MTKEQEDAFFDAVDDDAAEPGKGYGALPPAAGSAVLVRKLTLAQRYPNVAPRLMTPATLKAEGKAISCVGQKHTGSEWGILADIWTLDGNGVNELHIIRVEHLPNHRLCDLKK